MSNYKSVVLVSCWLSRLSISQSHSLNFAVFLNCPLIWAKKAINKITKRENLSRILLPPPFQPLSITEGQ